MALSCYVDAFNIGTGAVGSTVVRTGYGFQPKVCLYWWSGRTESSDASGRLDVKGGFGVAVSSSERACITVQTDDAASPTATDRKHNNALCIECLTAAGAVDGNADLQSFDSDGQTLVIDDQFTTNLRVHCLALGGTDLTNAALALFQAPTATGTQDITSLSFQPDCLLFFSAGLGTAPPASAVNGNFSLGCATRTTNGATAWLALDALSTTDTTSYMNDDAAIALFSTSTASLPFKATLTTMLSNGFSLNWSAATTGQPYIFALALKGGSYLIGDVTILSPVGTTEVESGFGFAPTGVFWFGNQSVLTSSVAAGTARLGLGAMTGPTSRGMQGWSSRDAQTSETAGATVEHDQCYVLQNTSGGSQGLLDCQSMDSNGFTTITDAVVGGNEDAMYLAIGSTVPLSCYVDTFNIGTGIATSTVVRTGYGFRPKACIYFWGGSTSATDTASTRADLKGGIGVAVAATDRRCMTVQSDDTANTMAADRKHNNAQCIECLTIGGLVDGNADLQSFDVDGQTLVIDDQFTTNIRVTCLALGGGELTNAATFQFQAPTVTGNADFTGLTFQPDALLLFSAGITTAPPAITTHHQHCIGVVAGAGQAVIGGLDQDAIGTSDANSYGRVGECIAIQGTGAIVSWRASFVSFLSTGFRLNWTEVLAGAPYVFGLALQGGDYAVGDFTGSNTVGATLAETGLGFAPKGVFFLSHAQAQSTQDTTQTNVTASLGACTSTSNRGVQAWGSQDAAPTAVCVATVRTDAIYQAPDFVTPANTGGLIDIQSIDSDGFTAIVDAAAGSALVSYLAFGSALGAVSPPAPTSLPLFPRPWRLRRTRRAV